MKIDQVGDSIRELGQIDQGQHRKIDTRSRPKRAANQTSEARLRARGETAIDMPNQRLTVGEEHTHRYIMLLLIVCVLVAELDRAGGAEHAPVQPVIEAEVSLTTCSSQIFSRT